MTLKRVITNYPEKIIRESVAQMNPAACRRSETAALPATIVTIGAVRLSAIVQEGRSDRSASRIASGPRRFL